MWEYLVLRDSSESTINNAGAIGWELISVIYKSENNRWYFYFKRPKK